MSGSPESDTRELSTADIQRWLLNTSHSHSPSNPELALRASALSGPKPFSPRGQQPLAPSGPATLVIDHQRMASVEERGPSASMYHHHALGSLHRQSDVLLASSFVPPVSGQSGQHLELRAALEVNERIEAVKTAWNMRVDQLQQQMSEKRRQASQLELDIGILSIKIAEARECGDRKVWELLRDPAYRTPDEVAALMQERADPHQLTADASAFLCAVCSEIPADRAMLFSCSACNQLVCEACEKKLGFCPSCRREANETAVLKRNRLAERMVEAIKR